MTQYIQFQKIGINGMIVKMGSYYIRIRIIRRMLNRSKGINVFTKRKNDNSARMLSGRSSDTGTSLHDPVNLAVSFMNSSFFIIIFYIAESSLIRQRTNRSRTECLSCSEDNLRIFMCLTLIFSRKIQVNIRLFISFKSKERLKWDIKSCFHKRCSAVWADRIRHITSCSSGIRFYFRGIKIIIMAFLAVIMGTQRIYFCDSGHGCHKRRSYRSTGSHQISVFIGFPYQFLSNDIHNRITIGNNRIQFSFQTGRNDLRKILPIDLMCTVITDFSQHIIRIFNNRRELSITDRAHTITHFHNLIWISNNDLFRLLRPQIFKFFQHLFGSPQIQRSLIIRIGKSFSCHDNSAVYLILRIYKMNITGCHYRFMELLPQLDNPSVQIPQIFFRCYIIPVFIPNHKHIIADGLYLQIVIKFHQTGNLRIRCISDNSLKQFTCFAGRTDHQTLLILQIYTFGNSRTSVIIIQMRF